MTNLILGGNGLLGKSLHKFLLNQNEKVLVYGNRENQDARFEKIPLLNIERIFFLAWDVGGSKYLYNKDSQIYQLKHNTALLLNVMPQLEKIPFIFASTQLAENCNISYGVTKRLGEVWSANLNAPVARLQNIYGPVNNLGKKNHVIIDFIVQALKFKKITTYTDGEESREFLHADDAARAIYKIMLNKNVDIFDVSSHIPIKIKTIAEIIQKFTNCEISFGKEKGANHVLVKKTIVSDFYPEIPIEEGISQMINSVENLI